MISRFFSMETIEKQFPGYKTDYLSKIMYSLQNDGFVEVIPADNCAYVSELLVDGIIHCEENTLLKKGYSVLKELKTLLS